MDETRPLARYPVRTPGWVWLVLALTAAAAAWISAWVIGEPILWLRSPLIPCGLIALVALLPCLALWVSRPYRFGEHAIDLYADRIEVPRAWRGRLPMSLGVLHVERVHIVQSLLVMGVPAARLDRGEIVSLGLLSHVRVGGGREACSAMPYPRSRRGSARVAK
jgi:hypothetical protein